MIFYAICSFFDLFVIYTYIRYIMDERKENIPYFVYLLLFVIDEGLLIVNSLFPLFSSQAIQMFFNTFISIALTFLLTFLHYGLLHHRIFIAISFQVFAALSEAVPYLIFPLFPKELSETLMSSDIYMVVISKILLFIFVNLTMLFFKKSMRAPSGTYTLMILVVPALSLFELFMIPLQPAKGTMQYTMCLIAACGILFMNIINYFLLLNVLKVHELNKTKKNLSQQIQYQVGKYQQLSTAYRDTRRLIHDTKKHFFYIENCILEKDTDEILSYLHSSMNDLEQTYITVNTGNLVIDSFLSNYVLLAKQEGIQFRMDLQVVPQDIAIRDYDLSIILGNLLDNAMNACRKIASLAPRQISATLFTTSKEFVIHIENTITPSSFPEEDSLQQLNHGYGTKNVENITLKYMGNYSHNIKNDHYHAIVSIPHGIADSHIIG